MVDNSSVVQHHSSVVSQRVQLLHCGDLSVVEQIRVSKGICCGDVHEALQLSHLHTHCTCIM